MFEIVTVVIVLTLFGSAMIYANKIEKHIEAKAKAAREAQQNAIKTTHVKQSSTKVSKNKEKKKKVIV